MPATATARQAPTIALQGIDVPAASINPKEFFAATRRLTITEKTVASWQGFGNTDTIQMLQTGVLSQLQVHVVGSITVTPGGGTVASTARWPYDLVRAFRFTANGQSNLVNSPGSAIKLRDIQGRGDLTDRGVPQGIGGASPGTTRQNGTLSLASESWGVGSNVSGIGAGTYNVDLTYTLPIAFDQVNLLGSIFAQTASTDLALYIDWANQSDVFTLTGNATVTGAIAVIVEATIYSIPQGPHGIWLPDLSSFHSYITSRTTSIGNTVNETRLAGQGVGRSLLRLNGRILNGNPGVPLVVNATNYGVMGWRFGTNDTPEQWTGQTLRYANERLFDSDFGAYHGYFCIDFASEHAYRDSVDEGSATELRLITEIPNGVVLTGPVLEYTQETVFAGVSGA